MTKSKSTPEQRSKSRKPRRRVVLNGGHDSPVHPPASDNDAQGAKTRSQLSPGGSGAYPSSATDEPDDTLDVGLPDDHPAVRAFYDGADEDERVGYKNPPKKNQFRKGKSGNPSGKRKAPVIPPGTVIALIGKTILEEISDLMRSPIRDLAVHEDDIVATAFAKRMVADAVKMEGRSRTLVISYFVDPQRTADRYQQPDHDATEAKMLGEMAQAIIDPTITDEEMTEKMDRWLRTKEEIATFQVGPLDDLPALPKPKKSNKAGKANRRVKPHRPTKPTTPKPPGEKT